MPAAGGLYFAVMRTFGISSFVVLVLVSTGLLAGCGSDKVDAEDAASTIQKQYPGESDGLELTSITCEEGEAEVDSSFTCSAENDAGVSLEIGATVTEIDGDRVNFTWSTIGSTSDGSAYAESAVTTLQNQGYAVAAIDCPEIRIESGNEVECEVTMDNGSRQTATVTLTDDDGGFDVVTSGPR
jgi:hypothetical protein